ncbi:uncharacterized protein LOC136096011 [Hydra vulgaris]|uniref:uncharacterized protein LOC136096011 n=1 Tax=Hydra vulgaris TaxID=6087 RepID=UPI0032EA426C
MSQLFTCLKNDDTTVFSQAFKLKFSDCVGVDWRTLGCWLNIEENYLDMIDKDNSKSDEKAYSMLTKWLKMNCNPTLDELKTALKEMKRMDLVRMVDEFTNTANSPEISSGFSANKDMSRVSAELKQYYLKYYGKIIELQPLLKAPANVDLMGTVC